MVKKSNFNRTLLGCFFKSYRYWYTDLLFEDKFYFVSEHLLDDSDKLAGAMPKCIVVRPAFSPLGIVISDLLNDEEEESITNNMQLATPSQIKAHEEYIYPYVYWYGV